MIKKIRNLLTITALLSVTFVSCLEDVPPPPEGDFVGSMEGNYTVTMQRFTLIDSVMEAIDGETEEYVAQVRKGSIDKSVIIDIDGLTEITGSNCYRGGTGVVFEILEQTATYPNEEGEKVDSVIIGYPYVNFSNGVFEGTYDLREEILKCFVKGVVEIPEGEEETFVQYVDKYVANKIYPEHTIVGEYNVTMQEYNYNNGNLEVTETPAIDFEVLIEESGNTEQAYSIAIPDYLTLTATNCTLKGSSFACDIDEQTVTDMTKKEVLPDETLVYGTTDVMGVPFTKPDEDAYDFSYNILTKEITWATREYIEEDGAYSAIVKVYTGTK